MNLIDLKQAPVVDKAKEGATLFALNTDGTVERISAENVGGGKVAKFVMTIADGASTLSLGNLRSGIATVDAADGATTASNPTYTITCDNMTFEEAKAILLAGEKLDAVLMAWKGDSVFVALYAGIAVYQSASGGSEKDANLENIQLWMAEGTITWTADSITYA